MKVSLGTIITIVTLTAAILASYYGTTTRIARLEEVMHAQAATIGELKATLKELDAKQDASALASQRIETALKVKGVIQ